MSRRPEVPAPTATVVKSTTGTSLWENPKVKMGAIVLVALVAGWFLYRTIRKNQVKKESQATMKEEEAKQWKTNFDTSPPRPRPQFPRTHPAVSARTMPAAVPPRHTPHANNPAQTPPANGFASSAQLRSESTRPTREEGFSDLPQADINPPAAAAPGKDGFTQI